MVEDQLHPRGIRDPTVLAAMGRVPREAFVPAGSVSSAYDDGPLAIGHGQTISQPYIVALMSELLQLRPGQRVLEVGTGCGYQTAILAEMGADVFTIEVVPELARDALDRLHSLGYEEVHAAVRDGWAGWPEAAPFDRILVACAPAEIPESLIDQLAPRGRLVLPLESRGRQDLTVVQQTDHGPTTTTIAPVRFVPMVKR